MSDEGGEKTEEPTPKKLDDARRKGQVWKSKDLSGAVVFIAGFFVMAAFMPFMMSKYREAFALAFEKVALREISRVDIAQSVYQGLFYVVLLTVPVAGAAGIAAGLIEFLQIGSLFTLDPVMPKLDKINPIQGLKNLFSKKQFVELIKSTVKLSVAGYLAWDVLRDEIVLVTSTALAGPALIMVAVGQIIYKLSTRIMVLFVLFAVFDVWWQRRVFMKDMMMTKDEVKREYKESEGDPHHKAKRKELHQEILEGAQMEEVAHSDVVVTNPTHYAVALRYQKDKDNAPRIVAKGLDAKAQRIKALAKEAGVTEVRNVPLAHALYRIDVGQEIPEGLYDAVAEVLNFVYAQQQALERAGSAGRGGPAAG